MNTPEGWAMFGFGAAAMLVLVLIAVALLLRHWGKVPPPEFREKPPEHWNCRSVPAKLRPDSEGDAFRMPDSLTREERDRMTFGRWPDSGVRGMEIDASGFLPVGAMFVLVSTDGTANTRRVIDCAEARALALAIYGNDAVRVARMLGELNAGKCNCVSVAGGMLERPRKIGEVPSSTPGRDSVSPLRNHPEFANDPSYLRQCLADPAMAEDYAARIGRRPELFAFRMGPGERGQLLTRKQAEEKAATHYGAGGADAVASLARGACDFVGLAGTATIRRYEPAPVR